MAAVVLIGASTGAPRTHHLYLQEMPSGFAACVVIIQHMPRGPFIHGFLRYLHETVDAPVKMAGDGDPLLPGTILIVEPGYHLRFAPNGRTVQVSPQAGENYFAPAMNVTFASAAQVFGPRCYVGMLSGLHADIDGLEGCRAVRAAGGMVLIADRASAACYNMIEQVREAGAFDAEGPLQRLLPAIKQRMRN
jgi:two-component system chemotaxis response regulator CheB